MAQRVGVYLAQCVCSPTVVEDFSAMTQQDSEGSCSSIGVQAIFIVGR